MFFLKHADVFPAFDKNKLGDILIGMPPDMETFNGL
jgi:hypothetical protein